MPTFYKDLLFLPTLKELSNTKRRIAVRTTKGKEGPRQPTKIIAGSFNAWAMEWRSRETNERERILIEGFSCLNVTLTNIGSVNTFRLGELNSVVDVSFVSDLLLKSLHWHTSKEYTHSDNQATYIDEGPRTIRIHFWIYCSKILSLLERIPVAALDIPSM